MLEREVTLTITKEEAPWAPDEEIGVYVIRRWSWRQKQKAILDASMIIAGEDLAEINIVDYEVNQMVACIKQAPEGLDVTFDRFSGREAREATGKEEAVEAIEGLDADVGTLILAACRKVNGLAEGAKRDFLLPTEPEEKAATLG